MDSDLQHLHPVTSSSSDRFGKVPTVWAATSYLVLCALFEFAVVLVKYKWPPEAVQCDPLYIFLYVHVAFWFITLIVDHFFKWRHHVLYLKGYIEFSEELKKLGSFPFLIVSLWNAVFLLMLTIYHHFNLELEPACHRSDITSPVTGTILVFTLEIILIFVTVIKYIHKVRAFNQERHVPDVHHSGRLAAPLHSFVAEEVGFKEQVHGLEDLLEKQADLIKFFKNENETLNKKILTLNCQLRGESIN